MPIECAGPAHSISSSREASSCTQGSCGVGQLGGHAIVAGRGVEWGERVVRRTTRAEGEQDPVDGGERGETVPKREVE